VTTADQEAAFARRCRVRLDGRQVWILSAADLVSHKLVAGRSKELADVPSILAVQGLPDGEYLDDWSRRLRIEDALAKALTEAGLAAP
jgi:hypothetical protein